jgi:hypothetical protein
MKITLRGATLRLIAIIVLLSGAADYFAFDVTDPLAPMSAAGTPSFISQYAKHHLSSTAIRHPDGADDGCICCAAGFPAPPIMLRGTAIIAIMNTASVLRPCDPQLVRVDPPPRA